MDWICRSTEPIPTRPSCFGAACCSSWAHEGGVPRGRACGERGRRMRNRERTWRWWCLQWPREVPTSRLEKPPSRSAWLFCCPKLGPLPLASGGSILDRGTRCFGCGSCARSSLEGSALREAGLAHLRSLWFPPPSGCVPKQVGQRRAQARRPRRRRQKLWQPHLRQAPCHPHSKGPAIPRGLCRPLRSTGTLGQTAWCSERQTATEAPIHGR